MKAKIPIPEGMQVPEDGYKKPFQLSGVFVVMGEYLVPLEIGGLPVPCGEDEDEEYEGEEGEDEGGGEKEMGECCGAYKKGPEHMCPDCPKGGGGFLIAIERAMKR